MLSSAKIGRSSWRYYQRSVAGGACEYFGEHGEQPGRWHGAGLSELGLAAGTVVEERELEALFGRALSPTTSAPLGSAWRTDAVTGYDLTFSAPKSVSAMWALGDQDIVAVIDVAHTAAVHAALGYLQVHASMSRRGRDGVEQISSGGYAAALFDHRTSRTGDPQLHTHALVVNKVRCADGVWRTLDGHEVYHHKKSAGAIYQAALRAELTARLPVVFGSVSEHGQAEIAGVPDDLLTTWSTRSAAVMADVVPTIAEAEDTLGRRVSATERARIIKTAVLATRPPKETDVAERDLRARWIDQAAGLGWNPATLADAVRSARASADLRPSPTGGWQQVVIVDAVTAVGRSKAIWSRADLAVQVAARIPTHSAGVPRTAQASTTLVETLANIGVRDPSLSGSAALGPDQKGVTSRLSDDRYASQELVDTEARILERAISCGFRTPSHLPAQVLEGFFNGQSAALSAEQRQAAVRLVASRDLVTVMTAPAGAGKTTTLAAAVGVWSGHGFDVVTLAPSARAAAELSAATGAPGQTVARWLLAQQRLEEGGTAHHAGQGRLTPRSVVIVDEASMLTTADLDQLTARAARAGAGLVLVGDPAQIGAVNAPGGMFEHLTHTFASWTVELTELHRFTHRWEADATLRIRDGDANVLTDYLNHDRIHPEASSEDAADAVFDRWQHATEHGRDALMLARAWSDVSALNARARAVGIATGAITGPGLVTVTSRTASTGGQAEARSWRSGDVLIAKKNTARIAIGADTLRNGDRFRVLSATADGGLVVVDLRGRGRATLPTSYLARYAEYGWAATIDGAQGATADIGIVLARSGLDREHLYVAMTRGRDENHVHTTPELSTGEAGPHTPTPAPAQHPDRPAPAAAQPSHQPHGLRDEAAVQLALPDLDAAISLLTRALASSGRERAAHSHLDPAVTKSRERAWTNAEKARSPRPLPDTHRRHQQDLDRARASRNAAQARVRSVTTGMREQQAELDTLPLWSRRRRHELTLTIDTGQTTLAYAINDLHRADTTVDSLNKLVNLDTEQRRDTEHDELEQRRHTWVQRPSRPYVELIDVTTAEGSRRWTARPPQSSHQPVSVTAPREADLGITR